MTKNRNISDLLDANGDVKSGALDNVPASNDASALTTGTLPIARIADGDVATAKIADGAVTSAKLSAGKVLQVVSATISTTASSTAASYADTGLTASITPSSTSNKILVLIQQNGVAKQSANTAVNIKILRDSTEIGGTDAGKNIGYTSSTAHNFIGNGFSCSVLDAPSSTSALTYKTQFLNTNGSGTAYVQVDNGTSYITLMEISA
tara:strand:+ start:818 stop:1438 length:621 start_codon:yes stop_codon:yes gene_type:complete